MESLQSLVRGRQDYCRIWDESEKLENLSRLYLTLVKFTAVGWRGNGYILEEGFEAFAKEYPLLIDKKPGGDPMNDREYTGLENTVSGKNEDQQHDIDQGERGQDALEELPDNLITESPTEAGFGIYDAAYRQEVDRIRATQGEAATVYLTRKVEVEKEHGCGNNMADALKMELLKNLTASLKEQARLFEQIALKDLAIQKLKSDVKGIASMGQSSKSRDEAASVRESSTSKYLWENPISTSAQFRHSSPLSTPPRLPNSENNAVVYIRTPFA
jgi:hypothetical protein